MILSKFIFRRNILILLALMIISSACSEKKKIGGKKFIPREVLVPLMKDLHLMDGLTNDTKFYRKYNPHDSVDMYTAVFEKHAVSREDFEITIAEYSKYPDLLDEIYDEVLMELNLMLEREEKVNREDNDRKLTPADRRKELPVSN